MTADVVRDLSAYLSEWLDYQVWRLRIPGVQAAVRVKGELVHSSAHGMADVEAGDPLRTDHLMRVASHSKTFTAVAVQTLVAAGQLRLDDTVGQHLQDYAETQAADVTVRELLSHTAGIIRDGVESDHWSQEYDFPSAAELYAEVRDNGIRASPCQYFKYSNIGYGMLGAIIERVTGQGFEEYLKTAVIDPLQLASTYPDYHDEIDGDFAHKYSRPKGADYHRDVYRQIHSGALTAATGFISTAEDLTAFYGSLVPGGSGILTDRQRFELARAHSDLHSTNEADSYGLGLFTETVSGRPMVGHSGGWMGTLSRTGVDFSDGLSVSVIGNSLDAPVAGLFAGVIQLIDLASKGAKPWQAGPAGVALDQFVGRYSSDWLDADIIRCGDRLVMVPLAALTPGPVAQELRVIDANTIRLEDKDTFGGACEDIPFGTRQDGQTLIRIAGETQVRVKQWSSGHSVIVPDEQASIDLDSDPVKVV